LTITKETYDKNANGWMKDVIVGLVASVYAVWLVYAAGLDYLVLTMLLYAPGIILYKWTKKKTRSPRRIPGWIKG